MAFYGGLFGWALENRVPPGAPGEYHVATLDGRTVAVLADPQGATFSVSRYDRG